MPTDEGPSSLVSVAAHLAVAMPEFGWSIIEPLFMPLLLRLKMPTSVLSLCWLFSPIFSGVLQPVIGALSDRHGRRPFVIVCGGVGSIALAMTGLASSFPPGRAAIAVVLICFCFADLSHDLLVVPTRATMNDLFDADVAEKRSALGGGFGKLTAFLLAATLSNEAAWFSAAAVLGGTALLQVGVAAGNTDSSHLSRARSCSSNSGAAGAGHARGSTGWPRNFLRVWLLCVAGWLAMCTFAFYVTSVWAQRSVADQESDAFTAAVREATWMITGSMPAFLLGGAALPALAHRCGGELNLLMAAVAALGVSLASFASVVPAPVPVLLTVTVQPVAYQVISNTPFAWLEKEGNSDPSVRGSLTGWLNSSLSVGQALIAILGGPIVALHDGKLFAAFAVSAGFCAAVLGAMCVLPQAQDGGESGAPSQKVGCASTAAAPLLGS